MAVKRMKKDDGSVTVKTSKTGGKITSYQSNIPDIKREGKFEYKERQIPKERVRRMSTSKPSSSGSSKKPVSTAAVQKPKERSVSIEKKSSRGLSVPHVIESPSLSVKKKTPNRKMSTGGRIKRMKAPNKPYKGQC